MTPTTAPIEESQRIELGDALDQYQANLRTLHENAKQAHWNVQGPQFSQLHALFEEVATVAAEQRDKLAETARYLGAQPNAHRVSSLATIPVYPSGDTCDKYTRAVLASIASVIESFKLDLIADLVTQNTAIATIESLRVLAYKLQAHIV